MILLKKTYLLFCLVFCLLVACTSEPKSPPIPPPAPPLPLEFLPGTWEVSDAERNGKNTSALEGIYFTFTKDEKLTSNFNLSVETQTFPYQMEGETLKVLSDPQQLYFIESLAEKAMVIRTRMGGVPFRLTLNTQQDESIEIKDEI